LFVALRVERHQTICLLQGMRSNDEIGKQTLGTVVCSPSSPPCMARETAAGLQPYELLKLEIDVDACIGEKAVHKGFCSLRMSPATLRRLALPQLNLPQSSRCRGSLLCLDLAPPWTKGQRARWYRLPFSLFLSFFVPQGPDPCIYHSGRKAPAFRPGI